MVEDAQGKAYLRVKIPRTTIDLHHAHEGRGRQFFDTGLPHTAGYGHHLGTATNQARSGYFNESPLGVRHQHH